MHMKQKFGSNEDTDLSHKLTFDCQLDNLQLVTDCFKYNCIKYTSQSITQLQLWLTMITKIQAMDHRNPLNVKIIEAK
jgi:hypothetical protein